MSRRGLRLIGLMVMVPLGLSAIGVVVTNKDKTNRLYDVFQKVSSKVNKNSKAIKELKARKSTIVPNRYLDLSINRGFLEHAFERERINKCNFKISVTGNNEMRELEQIMNPKTDIDREIKHEMVSTLWEPTGKNAIDKACMKFREVRISKKPSKVWLGWSYWEITGIDDSGIKHSTVDSDSWWWQYKLTYAN